MLVRDLINELRQFDPLAKVVATWEGTIEEIKVYTAADGRVMIDADSCDYQAKHQKLTCVDCNGGANGITPGGEPLCYACMAKRHRAEGEADATR